MMDINVDLLKQFRDMADWFLSLREKLVVAVSIECLVCLAIEGTASEAG